MSASVQVERAATTEIFLFPTTGGARLIWAPPNGLIQ